MAHARMVHPSSSRWRYSLLVRWAPGFGPSSKLPVTMPVTSITAVTLASALRVVKPPRSSRPALQLCYRLLRLSKLPVTVAITSIRGSANSWFFKPISDLDNLYRWILISNCNARGRKDMAGRLDGPGALVAGANSRIRGHSELGGLSGWANSICRLEIAGSGTESATR